ncbi:MAG TPA: TolC family protein [Acidobacteriota bacterium]|nr:TolC family protein [Acidobacteriota bacterium]
MQIRKLATILLLLAGILLGLKAQDEPNEIQLSLEECITKALKNNLNIQVELIDPELAQTSVSQAQEQFIPTLSMSFNRRDENSASYSFLDAADTVQTTNSRFSTEISQLLPTGGNFSLSLNGSMYDTNRNFMTINPRYSSQLSFDFSQPLLKNFGINVTRKDIIVAKNQLAMSEEELERALQEQIYQVEQAYWNYVYSIENLEVQRQSLSLAEELLDKNKRSVEVGAMAPIEIINAQATVAQRRADILAAEAEVKNNEDRLKTIINLAADVQIQKGATIIPTDEPEYKKVDMSLDEALSIAMQNRPDLTASRIGLENSEINLNYTKNQLLPGLNFTASYWSPGVSGDQLLYLNDNPLTGQIVGKIPGGFGDSFSDALGFKYQNWSVGLTLDVPLSNILSRAQFQQARLSLEKAKLQLKNQEQEIFRDIKIAVRNVTTNYERIQAYKAARELAERQLEAEEEKLKVGLTTNYLVLQYQAELASTLSSELKSVIDYKLALAQLYRDLGISLGEKNISLMDIR